MKTHTDYKHRATRIISDPFVVRVSALLAWAYIAFQFLFWVTHR